MSRIKVKKRKVPGSFITHSTERTTAALLMHWMRNIIEKKKLDLGPPDVEKGADDRKFPDIEVYESKRSKNVLCVIETKPPYFDVFNEKELKKPAWEKANFRKAKYFAVTNFQKLICYKTQAVNELKPENEQIFNAYNLSEIHYLNEIEDDTYAEPTKKSLEKFLTDLYEVHCGVKAEPQIAIDDLLIWYLYNKIIRLTNEYKYIISDKFHKDKRFSANLQNWFREQTWNFSPHPSFFEQAARQTAYLLINKIVFYFALQPHWPRLAPLWMPPGMTYQGNQLRIILQSYFDIVLKEIDYQTIYDADFIDNIAFPDSKEVIREIEDIIRVLGKYNFGTLGYDIIGGIFEKLIPEYERHKFGQYFTNTDVVDLILRFCLHHETEIVLDPSCGAGTFLKRAYYHKLMLFNARLRHEEILSTLWGNDIAKFPAHLAAINLAINDLSVKENYPNIIKEDFFKLNIAEDGFAVPKEWITKRAVNLNKEEKEIVYPKIFDVVIGNPPYTRQEEIEDTGVEKEQLVQNALKDLGGNKIASISKRASIHAYFFVHETKFLKEGGHFGFIVSNSWLDVDYGKGLQEFFLRNYKIIAIIESKVERWFADADINTCIIILEKCGDEKNRMENLVRFVNLKKQLRYFIPAADESKEGQRYRFSEIEKLIDDIIAKNKFYESDDLRVFPVTQEDLWEEGTEQEIIIPSTLKEPKSKYDSEYKGAKWGKYLRAPGVFFTILEKGKDKLVPLKEVAEVLRGFTTGANEFFYLTEEEINRKKIEKEFWMHKDENGTWVPNYIICSGREASKIKTTTGEFKHRVLFINKSLKRLKGKNVLCYINKGEKSGLNKRPTLKVRKQWYELSYIKPGDYLYFYQMGERFLVLENNHKVFADCNLFNIYIKERKYKELIGSIFNTTLFRLILEIQGRQLLGALTVIKIQVYELLSSLIFNPKLVNNKQKKILLKYYEKMANRDLGSIFDELGGSKPSEVSLAKVMPDRRELDKIIMGELLGLTDEEQLEVYRSVVDLVKSRLEKAKSVEKSKKYSEGLDMELVVNDAIMSLKNNKK
jgi:hypothetical protein